MTLSGSNTERAYEDGERLLHHAGSVWEVVGRQVNGDYWIRCVVGNQRPGYIGGEVAGRETNVHPDYLHGNGWSVVLVPEQDGGSDG